MSMVFSLGDLQKRLIELRKCNKILIKFQRDRHKTKIINIYDFAYLMKITFYTLLTHTLLRNHVFLTCYWDMSQDPPYEATSTFLWGYLRRNILLIFGILRCMYIPFDSEHFKLMVPCF